MKYFLDEIIKEKEEEVKYLKKKLGRFLKAIKDKKVKGKFKKSLSEGFNIIAEVKKASPSKGVILKRYNPKDIAKKYERFGASAISVLTCKKYFLGSIKDLKKIKEEVKIPVLRKDFIIDEIQVFESKYFGADAILLIVSILKKKELKEMFKLTKELNIDALVEVHSRKELNRALEINADIIGINNRNLKTLEVEFKNSIKLSKYIPESKIKISESGIKRREQIAMLKKLGFNGILIGHTLLKSKNLEDEFKVMRGGN